jgi:hypothetical protein
VPSRATPPRLVSEKSNTALGFACAAIPRIRIGRSVRASAVPVTRERISMAAAASPHANEGDQNLISVVKKSSGMAYDIQPGADEY